MFIEKEIFFFVGVGFSPAVSFLPFTLFSTHRYLLSLDSDPALESIVTSDGAQANYLSSFIFGGVLISRGFVLLF